MKTHFIELWKDMFKIPLKMVNMKAFPDHGWRFGNPKAFYISIDESSVKLGKNSLDIWYIVYPKLLSDVWSNWGLTRKIYGPDGWKFTVLIKIDGRLNYRVRIVEKYSFFDFSIFGKLGRTPRKLTFKTSSKTDCVGSNLGSQSILKIFKYEKRFLLLLFDWQMLVGFCRRCLL